MRTAIHDVDAGRHRLLDSGDHSTPPSRNLAGDRVRQSSAFVMRAVPVQPMVKRQIIADQNNLPWLGLRNPVERLETGAAAPADFARRPDQAIDVAVFEATHVPFFRRRPVLLRHDFQALEAGHSVIGQPPRIIVREQRLAPRDKLPGIVDGNDAAVTTDFLQRTDVLQRAWTGRDDGDRLVLPVRIPLRSVGHFSGTPVRGVRSVPSLPSRPRLTASFQDFAVSPGFSSVASSQWKIDPPSVTASPRT